MRGLEVFYIPGCPYCAKARKALEELKEENPDYGRVPVKWINEEEEIDYANEHNYSYVPTVYFGRTKMYEAHPGSSYQEIRDALKVALDRAVFEGPEMSAGPRE